MHRCATGERIVQVERLDGGITAEMRKLTIATPGADTRDMVLRTYVDPFAVEHAQDWLDREGTALTLLAGTDVPAPELVAVDPAAKQCEYPSRLMTHLAGQAVLDDEGLKARVPALARQLVAIHALQPTEQPRRYVALSTAVVPEAADAGVWAAAINVIRRPAPPFEGRFLHRDFQPGNMLFEVLDGLGEIDRISGIGGIGGPPSTPTAVRITGVADLAATSWGPPDLDVSHCSTNLALLHGPTWGQQFAAAYEQAGGVLAATDSERLYWRVLDALACSEEVQLVTQAWQKAGRAELTTRVAQQRLDSYVTALMDELG
ncbi:aminoglycoside phosphotransferase family protein [Catenulispora subtropica]|uniref:Aminoglycoside phosphotransferase domain-containing protein n=1 Tax=Catenulispora subtropica TaxID=450798 RepID=A0ABN2SXL4_9ACTN